MDNEGVKEIRDLASAATSAQVIEIVEPSIRAEPIPFMSVPNGDGGVCFMPIKSQLDEWRTAPERIKGTAKALTIDAFVDLVERHKSADSAVFGNLDLKSPTLTAVIDYHTMAHDPAWTGHCVHYAFPLSDEWKLWREANGEPMKQVEWAAFIEDHVADLSAPMDQEASTFEPMFRTKFATPSDLITMSRGMEIAVEGRVKEVRTLQSGEAEITYEEVHTDGRGAKLVVPGLFMISIPLFVGAEKERIVCRLRYRKVEQRIVWLFQMYRPDVVVREFLERTLLDVGQRTGLPTFEATPEA